MKNVENMLMNMDFSRFSKVRDSLHDELMRKYDMRQSQVENNMTSILQLSDDDLDMVVAAGASAPRLFDKEQN